MSAQFKGQLKWVAENVSMITVIEQTPTRCRVQITYRCDPDYPNEDVSGSGPTVFLAFIRAMNKAREEQARAHAAFLREINKPPRKRR